jgi:hypothetical protein
MFRIPTIAKANMSFLKYLHRLERIDSLIRRKATGTPEEFAEYLGLCRSALMEYIREMKELGAPFAYCRQRQSYFYEEEKQLFIGFASKSLIKKTGENGKRGVNIFL